MPPTPTVCVSYQVAREPEYLARSLAVMLTYPWVTSVVILHTDQEGEPKQHGKIQEFYGNFGYGFDKQPEEGGYNECDAYNRSLELGRATNCDWLLLTHADDFFLPDTYEHIKIADRCDKDVIFFEYFNFYSPTQYLVTDRVDLVISRRSPKLHDPHIRAIRSSSKVQWGLNRNEEARNKWKNRTIHCTPQGWTWPRAMSVPGMFHIHTRHMFEPKRSLWIKRNPKISDLRVETVPAGINIFPQIFLDQYVPLMEGP